MFTSVGCRPGSLVNSRPARLHGSFVQRPETNCVGERRACILIERLKVALTGGAQYGSRGVAGLIASGANGPITRSARSRNTRLSWSFDIHKHDTISDGAEPGGLIIYGEFAYRIRECSMVSRP